MTAQNELDARCAAAGHIFDVIEATTNGGPISVRCNRCHRRWPVGPEDLRCAP